MKFHVSKTKSLALAAVLLAGWTACNVGGSGTGQLSLSLTDKPSDDYKAVYITIKDIAVHKADDVEDSWTVAAEVNRTINLLELANGVREELALIDLPSGHYTQMRLMIGDTWDNSLNILGNAHTAANYVIDMDNQTHEMKIPSGFQTGVKLVQGFDINENSTTELTFDFDASRSVVKAGNSGKYILKPTIKVVDTALATVIKGLVTTVEGQNTLGVGGALVNIQIYDGTIADPKDQISIMTSTYTDDTDMHRGEYKFFFAVDAPATINLVTTKEGFVPAALRFPIDNGISNIDKNFTLVAPTGTGTLKFTVAGATPDISVLYSVRQKMTLEGTEVMVEIKSFSFVNGNPADLILLAGTYTIVASTSGKTTFSQEIVLAAAGTVTVPVVF
ncbi:MAG: DUF4382 domain-containing protein [Candidatus Aminicenantes bacterium]|nr:DUF4382 domain-containing protein [Candidatus Aminicenantes bacterium]